MCKYCDTSRIHEENIVDSGVGDFLSIGVDKSKKVYLSAWCNDEAVWYPNFCPVCGRDLRPVNHPESAPSLAEHFLWLERDLG